MKGVIRYLKFLLHFWSCDNSLKITARLESGIQVPVTRKIRNPVPGIRNPQRGNAESKTVLDSLTWRENKQRHTQTIRVT